MESTLLKAIVVTLAVMGLGRFSTIVGLPQQKGSTNLLCNSTRIITDNEFPPTVNLSVPTNATEIWFQNDTFKILQNMDLSLNLTCEASYPIQWVETYDKESDGKHLNLVKDLFNEVVKLGGEWLYRTVFTVKYPGSLCSVSNFSCQTVDNLCSQTNVILDLNQTADLISIHLSHQPLLSIGEHNDMGGKCDTILSYGLHPSNPSLYGWKCEVASSGKSITDRNEFLICDSAAHCNTFYQHQRMGTRCLQFVKECRYHCAYVNENFYHPGFVICRNQGLVLAQHYFYSVPQAPSETPDIYFDFSEADPQRMLVIEHVSNETYFGDNLTVFCQVSRYYFAYGHRFAFVYENGSMQYEDATDGEYLEMYNTNRINFTIGLTNPGALTMYCLAPVWNTSEWVNQSKTIEILLDPEPPSFSFTSKQEEEMIVWYTGDVNRTIICSATGKPLPLVTWTAFVSGKKHIETLLDKTTTEIEFPLVNEDIEGEYVCEAKNFLRVSRKIFHVVVIDRFMLLVKTVFGVIIGVFFLCLVIMVLCWKTIEKQKKQIRLLSEVEIKEFLEGNIEAVHSNDYLDTSDLIQSLPYNTSFEIPKEMIHIGTQVLGSGNFGQVLKGTIQLLQSPNGKMHKALHGMNSIDVAVKTVKRNMEVQYFKTLLSEVKIMAHIGKHPNIVRLVGACTQNIRKREIFIAVEFCINGSLEQYLRKRRSVFVNLVKDNIILSPPIQHNGYGYENEKNEEGKELSRITTHHLTKFSREVSNGMSYLGSKKIIHGDLATRNVFLSNELVVKIGDFGLSRQLLEYSNYVKNQECPLPWKWMAIESLQFMKFSVASDIWAFGVTIWEIFTLGSVPYPGICYTADFLDKLSAGMRMQKPLYATTEIYNIMMDCWNIEPSHRPGFTDLKIFFEKLLVDNSSQNYFQPSFESNANGVANGIERHIADQIDAPVMSPKSPPCGLFPDSGTVEDTQGYLLPLIEPPLL